MVKKCKPELLSPAGDETSFFYAISNGANAIYLGLDKFSARAYAKNFTLDNLKSYIDYAHLRNVRVFVTINIIIYDQELNEVFKIIDQLANMGVDALIVQDLAIFSYIVNNYKKLEAHISTQAGVDDYYGVLFFKNLHAKRIVLGREVNIKKIKDIKNKVDIELEAFIHGALCVCYSGGCLMSSFLGNRSGNRGRCAGCCRQLYSLIDLNTNKKIKTDYLLSMKDLNTSAHINELSSIDSLKIEGRMKDAQYVGEVSRIYRNVLDQNQVNLDELNKVFNRTYTKGYILEESPKEITNINRPNNFGYLIGEVRKIDKNKIWIKLFDELNKGDQIRIEGTNYKDDLSLAVTKLFNADFHLVDSSKKIAIIYVDELPSLFSKVYKTKDVKFLKQIDEKSKQNTYEKIKIDLNFIAHIDEPMQVKIRCGSIVGLIKSNYIVIKSNNNFDSIENIKKQLSKLNDTPYQIDKLFIDIQENIYIPIKEINELRRRAIKFINEKRLINTKTNLNSNNIEIKPRNYTQLTTPELVFEVSKQEQYDLLKKLGYKNIFFHNVIKRNNANYHEANLYQTILIRNYGAIEYFKGKEKQLVGDYSLNVTNHINAALLSSLGLDRVTLSLELSIENINTLISNYKNKYQTHPNLEMIIYGHIELMNCKYCVLKRLDLCGNCKKNSYSLKDKYEAFPLRFNEDCSMTILSSKKINLINHLHEIKGVNYLRVILINEKEKEILQLIKEIEKSLNNFETHSFNKAFDTLGHFYNSPQ